MKSELQGILEEVELSFVPSELPVTHDSYPYNIDPLAHTALQEKLTESVDAILSLIQSKLPKEDSPRMGSENAEAYEQYATGYNQCLQEVKTNLGIDNDK